MKTFSDIFEALHGPAEVGRIIGVSTEHASIMKRRGSIPPAYWSRLIDGVKAKGISGIDWELLATLTAIRRLGGEATTSENTTMPKPNEVITEKAREALP